MYLKSHQKASTTQQAVCLGHGATEVVVIQP